MVFKYLTVVFFALVCKANRVNPVDCSDGGMYSGIALKRDNIQRLKYFTVPIPHCAMVEFSANNFARLIPRSGIFFK